MTFTVEVLLKDTDRIEIRTIEHEGNEPSRWTDEDVSDVLKLILLTVNRVKHPAADSPPSVVLRGLSWIVASHDPGVVIAIEIPSGAAVAGPFDIKLERLDSMISRVLARPSGASMIH